MNNLFFLFILVPVLSFVLLALNVLLAVHNPDEAKVSAYECGMSPFLGQTRSTFQIHFFIVALLFLIFDLEILLLFPIAVSLYQVSIFGFSIAIVFFIILTIGFVLEIGSGAISLSNVDILYNKNSKSNPLVDYPKHDVNSITHNKNKLSAPSVLVRKRYYHNSNLLLKQDIMSKTQVINNLHQKSEFLNWLTGFTDAEGNFAIKYFGPQNRLTFVLTYHLHNDDLNVLLRIKSELSLLAGKEIGSIYQNKSNHSVELYFQEFNIIRDLILPIFNTFPLRTAKYLDFKDWEKAILLRNSLHSILLEETLTEILEIKKTMNSNRTLDDYSNNLIPDGPINPQWLLGFWEGDGSFYIKTSNLMPQFALTQRKDKSVKIMKWISDFILNLPLEVPNNFQIFNTDFKIDQFKTVNPESGYLCDNFNQVLFGIQSTKKIMFQILPFFENSIFLTRKGLDFQIWAVIAKARFFGYHKHEKAKEIMLNLANNMNNARYFNETDSYVNQIKTLNQIIEAHPEYSIKVSKKLGLQLKGPLTVTKYT